MNDTDSTRLKKNEPQMIIDNASSERITMMRFALMVLVVFIHNNVMAMSGVNVSNIPWYFHVIRILIAESFGSCAVPLFYLISGYLLYAKNEPYTVLLKKKFRTIFVPYVLWTVIAIGCILVLQSVPNMQRFFQNSGNNFKNFSIIDWIDVFIGRFTSREPYPFVYPFWFLRDLMLMIIVSPVIKKLIDHIPYCFISLVLVWWFHFPYGQVSSAILFFSLGYYAVRKNISATALDRIRFCDSGILYGVLAAANVFLQCYSYKNPSEIVTAFATPVRAFTIFSGCFFVLKLSGHWAANKKVAPILRYLATFSFWLYAVHEPVLLTVLRILINPLVPTDGAWIFVPYFALVIICIAIALLSGIVVKKLFPKLFAFLTGSR